MTDINKLINNLKAVDVSDIIQAATALTIKDLEKLQKEQMLSGEDSKGKEIGRYKNKKYAAAKHILNPLPGLGVMDFKLYGDFQKLIFSTLDSSGVTISSSDKKTARLLSINKDVFTLNTDHTEKYSKEHMGPEATDLIKRKIHGL